MSKAASNAATAEDLSTGQLIRYYRKRAGMTQAELADEVEMSEPGIRNYELGNRTPSKAQLAAIARGLGIEPEALITYDISSAREALGVLFQLEGAFGIVPNEDGSLSIDPKADGAQKMAQAIRARKRRDERGRLQVLEIVVQAVEPKIHIDALRRTPFGVFLRL